MSAPRVGMHRLQELVRLCRMGTGVRERARLLRMGSRTERGYREALEAAALLEGDVNDLPELGVLRAAVEAARPSTEPRQVISSVDAWMPQIRAAVENGSGATAIYDLLTRTDPEFSVHVSSVKRAVRRIQAELGPRERDVVIPVETGPGEVAQVDFGYAGRLFDEATGRIRKAWVFVMVLCYSRHMYAKLVFDQKALTWVRLHVEAFSWFGGVPHTIVPDNLKAAVLKAAFGVSDRHLLTLNWTYRELARFYGAKIDPAPVRRPALKGKVESAVGYVVGNYLAAGGFETLCSANDGLPDWLRKTAGMRRHGTTGRRPLEAFAEEASGLLPLPATPYEPVVWKQATVHRDSHIEFEGRLYSVPWPHLGARVWIKATPSSVLVYAQDERIATHERRGAGRRSTLAFHLPEHRAALADRCIDHWIDRGDRLDPAVGTFVRNVVASDTVLSKLRDVQGIVSLLERYPRHRAVATCKRADRFGNYSYLDVRRILDNALDLLPLSDETPVHGELSQPRFARGPTEQLPPERAG